MAVGTSFFPVLMAAVECCINCSLVIFHSLRACFNIYQNSACITNAIFFFILKKSLMNCHVFCLPISVLWYGQGLRELSTH